MRVAVNNTCYAFERCYDVPRVALEMSEARTRCSWDHVAELMREIGIKTRNGKRFRYTPPDGSAGVVEYFLARSFHATKANEKWVSDSTYINIG